MVERNEKLFSEFPPVSTQEWIDKVTADLKGADFDKKLVWRTNEGFPVKPMYRAEDIQNFKTTESLPGEFPYVRGTKVHNEWLVRQNLVVTDSRESNTKMLDLQTKGVDSFGLVIDTVITTPENIALLLKGIDPEKVQLNFKTCMRSAERFIENLTKYFKDNGYDLNKVKGSIDCDPIGWMMSRGLELPLYAEKLSAIINAGLALPGYRVLTVNSINLCDAGAYITQELGYALAWGNDLMAKLINEEFTADQISSTITFNMGIGSNYFLEIAKFRAARMLWAQIVSQYQPKCGCSAKMIVNAETSSFNQTIYDANVNMLRTQTEAMSAALAGVDSIVVTPYDAVFKNPDEFSERIARNQQLLLKEESHLNKIVDPAAGSYYIESLTMAIAEEAWKLFLEIEDNGGFIANVLNGNIQKAVNASADKRFAAASSRREILLGTNQYPNFNETASQKIQPVQNENCQCSNENFEASEPLEFDKDLFGEIDYDSLIEYMRNVPADSENPKPVLFEKLNTTRLGSQFEALRLNTEHSSHRPKAFMLTIGNLAMRLARAQFSCNFFGCAGYENIDNLGFDTIEAGVDSALKVGADIIVLCSSDDEYAELAPKALQLIGDKAILVIAGAPACAEDLKAAGITNFINVKSNVLETLKAFNEKLLK